MSPTPALAHTEGKIHLGHENVRAHHDRHHPGHQTDRSRKHVHYTPHDAVDLSVNNGSVTFEKVAPLDVIFKITEGATYRDPYATVDRVRAIRAAKIDRIAVYAFCRPDNNHDPKTEVHNVIRVLEALSLDVAGADEWYHRDKPTKRIRVYADFETPPFDEAWLHGWGEEFHRLADFKADLYGYGSSLNPCKGVLDAFKYVDFAAYVPDFHPYCQLPLDRIAYWQDSSSWHVDGVVGPVDHDRYLLGGKK